MTYAVDETSDSEAGLWDGLRSMLAEVAIWRSPSLPPPHQNEENKEDHRLKSIN